MTRKTTFTKRECGTRIPPLSMRVLLLWLFILALVSCEGLAGEAPRYNTHAADTVTIGAVYPASRWSKEYYMRDALDLAVDDVNKSGGVLGKPLAIIVRDDQGNARIAQQIVETFHDSGITAVVGHWSSEVCYYVEDIYEERQIVMITPFATSRSLFDLEYTYIFRMIANNTVYAEAFAEYAERQRVRTVAIYYYDDVYGIDLAACVERALAKRQIPVVDRVTSITAGNTAGTLQRWRAFGCGALLLAAPYPDIAEPVAFIRDAGSDIPVFSELFNYTGFDTSMASYLKNYYAFVYDYGDMDKAFLDRFRARYGRVPDLYEIAAYEAVSLLADAMNAEHSLEGSAIARYLSGIRDYPSVTGRISFNPETHEFDGPRIRIRPYTAYIVR